MWRLQIMNACQFVMGSIHANTVYINRTVFQLKKIIIMIIWNTVFLVVFHLKYVVDFIYLVAGECCIW